jgi:hypothetical protein
MPLKHRTETAAPAARSGGDDDRWRLVDLEAAQRRDLYAAGHGDGRGRTSRRRWTVGRAKRS